ncbi:MAG: DUF389 domain-containing protein, partial [Planctomycetes bacterium]|nr:DUF389 domain-containing protein [Planctomycetota bacterium]
LIAGLGLIQNATAVVVGAMLVAPLMTPIIGAGLGLVQGNAQLIRNACKSIGMGFIVALSIGLLLGWSVPDTAMNNELYGRGNPNAIDLFIALFSGIAAAYAMSRPNLSAALPGVAIAAALVPPIATVGISLALGDISNAEGAVLLFGTNVVAIIIGAAGVLHVVGMRPANLGRSSRLWVQRVMLSLIVCIIIFAVPLSSIYLAKLGRSETRSIKQCIQMHFADLKDSRIHDIAANEDDNGEIIIRVQIFSATRINSESIQILQKNLHRQFHNNIALEVIRIPIEMIRANDSD